MNKKKWALFNSDEMSLFLFISFPVWFFKGQANGISFSVAVKCTDACHQRCECLPVKYAEVTSVIGLSLCVVIVRVYSVNVIFTKKKQHTFCLCASKINAKSFFFFVFFNQFVCTRFWAHSEWFRKWFISHAYGRKQQPFIR